ncbi:MAG TPA: NUDIX hydrolase [Verrucomicrobiae bacterium]|nr:NUDIX hydrolase [Verrucomicrobiae bacterium]
MDQTEHKIAWQGKYLRIRVCGTWEYAERPNSPAGIVILAVTPEGKLLLTEQFRVPMQKCVIELPAGLAGDDQYDGEEFEEAAKRELREETGYEAAHWEKLIGGPTSPGLSNEMVVFFRGKDLRRVSEGGGEGGEKIVVHEVPVPEVAEWLHQKENEGLLIDPRIYAGLYFLAIQP